MCPLETQSAKRKAMNCKTGHCDYPPCLGYRQGDSEIRTIRRWKCKEIDESNTEPFAPELTNSENNKSTREQNQA